MADIEKVRVGDTLRVEVEVIDGPIVESSCPGLRVRTRGGGSKHTFFIGTIEAAEHIPAPRYFKRGEFVRSLVSRVDRGGLVVGRDINGEVWVTWPGNERYQPVPLPSETLEHDEAPE